MYTERESLKKAGQYIKVALLDDGVDPTYDQIGLNLHYAGWTPTDSGGPGGDAQSFYASTHQHGTKMAWLIRKVCPFVTIYVAKLGATGGDDLQRRSFGLAEATSVSLPVSNPPNLVTSEVCTPPADRTEGYRMGERTRRGYHLHELERPGGLEPHQQQERDPGPRGSHRQGCRRGDLYVRRRLRPQSELAVGEVGAL